ncbi:MAG: N-acetyl-gamma-glutamyl-phosphate reductase [Rikenellaceae bacterium]
MIKAGIIGGAGYTGGEMCRLLINHPSVELVYVHSNSNGGKYLWEVHSDLFGDTDIRFAEDFHSDIDVMFLCLGHGDSRKFLEANEIGENVKIIDLSHDFRLVEKSTIGNRQFVYGLCEAYHAEIEKASNIANPGCFATALQLAVLPLAAAGLLTDDIHASATTGSTGAGQKPTATTHFSWRSSNMSAYKMFSHQHLLEIGETLRTNQPSFDHNFNFVPYRGDFPRGIIATVYTKTDLSASELTALYEEYYSASPFTHVAKSNIHLKQVVNTNKAIVFVEKHGDNAVIISEIDNLLKGASGQAVQNMNIMFGLDEKEGLKLKPLAF